MHIFKTVSMGESRPPRLSALVTWSRSASLKGSSSDWMKRHVKDPYVKQAVAQDLRSRSAFKLMQIQDKHKILRPTDTVVDLGAAPGGWSLCVSKLLQHDLPASKADGDTDADGGVRARLVAVDLLPMEPVPHCHFIEGSFTSAAVRAAVSAALRGRGCHVLLSDMLQNTSGRPADDHFRSVELVQAVLDFARDDAHLRPNGTLLAKYVT
jgi:23S rRNA (uridine2552-2'-O)-methyltransferase